MNNNTRGLLYNPVGGGPKNATLTHWSRAGGPPRHKQGGEGASKMPLEPIGPGTNMPSQKIRFFKKKMLLKNEFV